MEEVVNGTSQFHPISSVARAKKSSALPWDLSDWNSSARLESRLETMKKRPFRHSFAPLQTKDKWSLVCLCQTHSWTVVSVLTFSAPRAPQRRSLAETSTGWPAPSRARRIGELKRRSRRAATLVCQMPSRQHGYLAPSTPQAVKIARFLKIIWPPPTPIRQNLRILLKIM